MPSAGRVRLLRHRERGLEHRLTLGAPVRREGGPALPPEEAGREGEALDLQEGQRFVPRAVDAHHRAQLGQRDVPDLPATAIVVGRRGPPTRSMRTTSMPSVTGSACCTTPSPSGTSVVHPSGSVASSIGMATTRPRAASNVVMASRRSPSNQACVVASTPPMRVRHSPLAVSWRCRSVRDQPTSALTSTWRPSGEAATSAHVSGVGRSSQTTSSSRPRPAQAVAEDLAVVLITFRIARVEEGVLARQPGHARRPGVRDLVGVVLAGGDVDHPQDAALVTALRDAVRDEATAGRRVVPVDRRRGVGHQAGRIDEQARRAGRIVGRTDDEDELLLPATPLQCEHAAPRQAHFGRDRELQQGDQAVQPGSAVGQGIERQPRPLVLLLDPGGDLGRRRRPPANGKDRGPSGRGARPPRRPAGMAGPASAPHPDQRRGDTPVNAPCWGACRGWPWSDACAPSSSWSSST